MHTSRTIGFALFILSLLVLGGISAVAGARPEITSQSAQYLDRALSVNVQWQSPNPVTKVKIMAGSGMNEVPVDEYENRRNPSGYQGEVTVVVQVDPAMFQGQIGYQIQIEDDLRQKSSLYSGRLQIPAGGFSGAVAPPMGGIPVVGGMPGAPGVIGIPMNVPPLGDDGWGRDAVRAGKGSQPPTEPGGNRTDMVDKLQQVADRFDTPPTLDVVKVDQLGPDKVSFSSRANDDKGLREVYFRVYDAAGNKIGEQKLAGLGKVWQGSTEPIKAAGGGTFRVVAQAVDTAGNTSKEVSAGFTMTVAVKPSHLAVTLLPREAVSAGAQWQVDGGAFQNSAASLTLAAGKHRVTFRDVAGWVPPAPIDLDVKEGDNRPSASYTVLPPKVGKLTVTLLPSAVADGALWTADGGAPQKSGAALSLKVGAHRIAFKDVPGWTTPAARDVVVVEGANQATGSYVAQNGTLTVRIVPASAVGAQWRIGTGAWQNGDASLQVPAGEVRIEFNELSGWVKPQPKNVTVVAAQKVFASGAYGRLYTSGKDFAEGTLVGLEDQTLKDQLQLSKTSSTLPFIWVPNSTEGTISKVNSATGDELGRYRTSATAQGSPSRTTVDLKGNCWVGNRNTGTVVKVGLAENGQCADRNGNGKIETSVGATPLDWGADECVLVEVVLNKGNESSSRPGEFNGGSNGSGPRGIAIDADNNLWAGAYGTMMYYHIDGSTGAILKKIDVSSVNHRAYGAVVDSRGVVWSADISNGHVMRLIPGTGQFSVIPLGHMAYGIGLDKANHLFVAGWTDNKLTRIDTLAGKVDWTVNAGDVGLRGVAVGNDGDVWVANSYSNSVTRWSNDGVRKSSVGGFNHPTGVATDATGKIWAVNYNDPGILRIDPAANAVDLRKSVGSGHYGYSDMTGIVARSSTTQLGTWTSIFDSNGADTAWGNVGWNGNAPQNTVIKTRVRSSADKTNWGAWEDAVKGIDLKATPAGRYLQLETTLQVLSGEAAPTLIDLTVTPKPASAANVQIPEVK